MCGLGWLLHSHPKNRLYSQTWKKIRREKNIFRICHTNRERVCVCVAICRCVYCLNGTTVDAGIFFKNARQILIQLQEKNERIKNSNIYMPGVQMDCNRKLNKRMCDYKKMYKRAKKQQQQLYDLNYLLLEFWWVGASVRWYEYFYCCYLLHVLCVIFFFLDIRVLFDLDKIPSKNQM